MEYYYRKLMGNGAVTSKFRLNITPSVRLNQSNLREAPANDPARAAGEAREEKPSAERSPLSAPPLAQLAPTLEPTLAPTLEPTLAPEPTDSAGQVEISSDAPATVPSTVPSTSTAASASSLFASQAGDEGAPPTHTPAEPAPEQTGTHHGNNCNRCYKLKKRCLREYPNCVNCRKSGSPCEYINRSNKRRKRAPSVAENESVMAVSKRTSKTASSVLSASASSGVSGVLASSGASGALASSGASGVSVSSISHLVPGCGAGTTFKEGSAEYFREIGEDQETEAAQKLVSIGQTLHGTNHQTSRSVQRPQNIQNSRNVLRTPHGLSRSVTSSHSLRSRMFSSTMAKTIISSARFPSSNLLDEFINMKPIPDEDLPTRFIHNYFHNYETRLPFVLQDEFMTNSKFRSIDFTKESIVNLDIYLLLCIGCLIHDRNTNSSLFATYFNEKSIDQILDVLNFDSLEGLRLLLLVILYKLNLDDQEDCWEMMGVLTRQMIIHGSHLDTNQARLFWSVYSLDKSLSLLLNRPSQVPPDDFIMLELPLVAPQKVSDYTQTLFGLINQEINYSRLNNRLLSLRLSRPHQNTSTVLKELSTDVEKWRVAISKVIHSSSHGTPDEYISLVNLNYYYYLIELDQLSQSESFQFTLQFLSNSFTLLIDDEENTVATSHRDDGKPCKRGVGLSLSTVFWSQKLFAVVKYSITSLKEVLGSLSAATNLKIVEFNSNLQLMINLFKYLSKLQKNDLKKIKDTITMFSESLTLLGTQMMKFLVEERGANKKNLSEEIDRITESLFKV